MRDLPTLDDQVAMEEILDRLLRGIEDAPDDDDVLPSIVIAGVALGMAERMPTAAMVWLGVARRHLEERTSVAEFRQNCLATKARMAREYGG